jgi:hypothetical protein
MRSECILRLPDNFYFNQMLCLGGENGALDLAFGGLVCVKGRIAKIGELVIFGLFLDS